ncbi:MAG: hypothetical protein HKM24_05630 [Gammaproteobacteria bacterium]|nr:hypothetical protein [Gammaproteobacteria bacterium]
MNLKNFNRQDFHCRSLWLGLSCVFTALTLGVLGTNSTFAAQLSPTQLQQLQSLDPVTVQRALNALESGAINNTSVQRQSPSADGTTEVIAPEEDEFARDMLEPRFQGNDSVVVELILRQLDTHSDIRAIEKAEGKRVYQLDNQGLLAFPGIGNIALAGLNEQQATLRLLAEPVLAPYDIVVTLLPLDPVDSDALRPFGYDVFKRSSKAISGYDVAVPADYVLGPGDTLNIQLFGAESAYYNVLVERTGVAHVPDIGPVNLAGMSFVQAIQILQQRFDEQKVGVTVSVTLGDLRTMQIFVVGEVESPGAHVVSPLATVIDAIIAGGGINERASIRNVELRRGGDLKQSVDLYDFLIAGDVRNDIRLQSGDVVVVPTAKTMVRVLGEVKRPGIYELHQGEVLNDVLRIAGGLAAGADRQAIRIQRVNDAGQRSVMVLDLGLSADRNSQLIDGDLLEVFSVAEDWDYAVVVHGHVYRPGPYEWQTGLRLTDIFTSIQVLKTNTDTDYVLIHRENTQRRPEVLSLSLEQAWLEPGDEVVNPSLNPRDEIYVFDLESDRAVMLAPLIDELEKVSTVDQPPLVVSVSGHVRAEGRYPLTPGMSVADLIGAAGGLMSSAYRTTAEVTRHQVMGGEKREVDHHPVGLNGDDAQFILQAFDHLSVKRVPSWDEERVVDIDGEVRFPGRYPIEQGESLSSVVQRAGGFTEHAYPKGAIFIREELRNREQEQLKNLQARLQTELAAISLENNESRAMSQGLLEQLQRTQAVGRLVIDLDRLVSSNYAEQFNVSLRDGDRLLVPSQPQEVTVIGEVQYPTSHIFREGLPRDEYIRRSGGLTANADRRRVYVVRASGEVDVGSESKFFSPGGEGRIEPGDTVVVPIDADRIAPLTLWSSVTQIVYNLAVAVAAVNSF